MSTTIIHSNELSIEQKTMLERRLGGELQNYGSHFRVNQKTNILHESLEAWRNEFKLDINIVPENFNPTSVRLLITDMDSTLINIECVDEIADFIGVKPQVASITEAAMRGDINFETSLTQRVALLKGLDISALERVYQERLQINPGGEALIAGLKARGIQMALVSGGFTFFTERLKLRLGLDYTLANVLAISDNKLEGQVIGNIVGAEAKAQFLRHLCEELEIQPDQVIAMGDGANDLKMLDIAGLGVAYKAKPKVRAQADVSIQYRGLDAVLDFMPTKENEKNLGLTLND
jgi:phosphoserine phosphatase